LDIRSFDLHTPLPIKTTLLAVGRLYPEKRWDRLIKGIAVTAARGANLSVRLAGEGPLLGTLRDQARRHNVEHLFQFLGPRSDIQGLMADSTFLVHTADEEGCPNVVMEAMASCRAVLATDAGDVPLLVEDGKTGFVVRREDGNALADRMVQLIANPQLCLEMGQNGRRKAEREFDLNHLVTDTLDAYRAIGWKD
jgi:glycosyltransferase involved in cell wall biosynthesis